MVKEFTVRFTIDVDKIKDCPFLKFEKQDGISVTFIGRGDIVRERDRAVAALKAIQDCETYESDLHNFDEDEEDDSWEDTLDAETYAEKVLAEIEAESTRSIKAFELQLEMFGLN